MGFFSSFGTSSSSGMASAKPESRRGERWALEGPARGGVAGSAGLRSTRGGGPSTA